MLISDCDRRKIQTPPPRRRSGPISAPVIEHHPGRMGLARNGHHARFDQVGPEASSRSCPNGRPDRDDPAGADAGLHRGTAADTDAGDG